MPASRGIHTMPPLTVDGARALMHEWVASPSLRHHIECVAACMAAYADALASSPPDHDRWVVCGLLHDFDYERHPTRVEHPFVGVAHLRERSLVDEEIVDAILGHAEYSGVPRRTPMAKALFAVDELAGFIVACGKIRPDGLATLEPRSVRKRLKEKSFAAAVSREDIARGTAELAELALPPPNDEESHFARCIRAIAGMPQA